MILRKYKTVKYKVTTLTPLRTGNDAKNMDKIRESGILGSMRWNARKLSKIFNGFMDKDKEDSIFGSTTKAKDFILNIEYDKSMVKEINLKKAEIRNNKLNKNGKPISAWFFREEYMGIFYLNFKIFSNDIEPFFDELFYFISNYSALGAMISFGSGVVDIKKIEIYEGKEIEKDISSKKAYIFNKNNNYIYNGYYYREIKMNNLNRIKNKISNTGNEYILGFLRDNEIKFSKIPLIVRHILRYKTGIPKGRGNDLFGIVKGSNKKGSKLNISLDYNNKFRIFGYIGNDYYKDINKINIKLNEIFG
ncbi:CRISPR type III-B/RAMP module RAMP protein Cmr1 [Marinitoga hydrogenitolerans DSM 16785]|uniref:CRISPR type III-B/RAMP module RAMP protein Cmr1 n=1 Tax=Marinitoga hydrogenitolerans (strain DSM 16785 / JCM 12826 / AT1271) TaxID=1122195 RepID=A0A1M5A5X2_MARH1|nr:type III-B CRISPR module RAMP protein Cmr1 [Marinitoga hydrogenitolerans]SHF25729.1 CRISPR type III-B/RAMP module RAMP protein Cmr1 [Marinitoga hydrogenitolerans DSM 16785]